MTPTRYPLAWPEGWKRTPSYQRKTARFGRAGRALTLIDGLQRVLDELEKLGIRQDDVIISTNLLTRLDGLPRSGQSRPADSGVCVYWQKSQKEPMRCMAIDRYTEVADNLGAIAATLDAMRAIERHGGAAILDRAFTGFMALPAPAAAASWRVVLELGIGLPTEYEINTAYRRLASKHHPDKGGDPAKMAELNAARDAALAEAVQ